MDHPPLTLKQPPELAIRKCRTTHDVDRGAIRQAADDLRLKPWLCADIGAAGNIDDVVRANSGSEPGA